MPIGLVWSGLFIVHREFADGGRGPVPGEIISPRGPLRTFLQGRLCHSRCQVVNGGSVIFLEPRRELKSEKPLCYCPCSIPRHGCLVPSSSLA